MSVMAQQTAVRSIPKYPFKTSDTETISGTTKSAVNFTGDEYSADAITTGSFVIPSFTQTLEGTLTRLFNENTVYYIVLDRLDTIVETLLLAEPIAANVTYQDSAYFCQNEDLGIFSVSAKLEDCIKDFQEEVLFVWNEYGKEDDDKLTKDAKELKRRILRYIEK